MDIYYRIANADMDQLIDTSSLKQNIKKREMISYIEQCLLHLIKKQK